MKILNFGSLNIDNVYDVEHFVRSGETILSKKLSLFSGGKGLNQSIAVSRAGLQVYHAGKIGKDGTILRQTLEQAGINVDFVAESEQRTGHAIIQVDEKGQNSILLFSGANHDITEEFIEQVLSSFDEGDILLLQNEINNIPAIMRKAKACGLLIAFNPSPISRELYDYPMECVKWFVLNEIEGNELTGQTDPVRIAEGLQKKYPGSSVVLTLGKDGVLYKDESITCRHGIYRVNRVDATAAGDTFTGYFLSGIAMGLEIDEVLRRASVASSLAVSRMGASSSIPGLEEVLGANLIPI